MCNFKGYFTWHKLNVYCHTPITTFVPIRLITMYMLHLLKPVLIEVDQIRFYCFETMIILPWSPVAPNTRWNSDSSAFVTVSCRKISSKHFIVTCTDRPLSQTKQFWASNFQPLALLIFKVQWPSSHIVDLIIIYYYCILHNIVVYSLCMLICGLP
jgi:hypothetical protein